LRNSTNTDFNARVDYATTGASPISVSVGDFNNDGKTDLAVTNGNFASVLTNNAAPSANLTITDVDTTAPTATATTATIQNFSSAVVQSTETGTAYLVKDSVTVNSLADITGAADNIFNSVPITAANTNTNLAATGLKDGTYKVYTVDAAGNLSEVAISSITIATPTTDPTPPPPVNVAPSFVGTTATLTVTKNAAATDIKALLTVSDSDSGQTETWTQSIAPNQGGVLTLTNATASSGSAAISANGTIGYTPTNDFIGTETFTVQVSDAQTSVTRQITVTVNDVAPAPTPTPTPVPVVTPPAPEPTPTPVPVVTPPAPEPVSDPTPAPVIIPPAPVVLPTPITSTVTVMVDGVWVNKTINTHNSLQVEQFNILPVSTTRVEDTRTAHATLADIPIGSMGAGGGLGVGLPVGVGLQTDGAATPVVATNMSGFISGIQTVFGNTAANAVADGKSFLANFTPSQTFFEQKIVFSTNSSTSGDMIIIDGSHSVSAGATNPVNTLVIDGSTLPAGSTVELIQTDFAAIKGDVTVKADPMPNILHIGSTQTQQTVFAYASNDEVQLDKGLHLVHGGLDTDTIKLPGKSTDYQMTQNFAVITLASKTTPNEVNTLVNVEKIAFEDQTIPVDYEVTPQIKAIAATYIHMFGRQADLGGEQYWADAIANKGLTLGRMALFFMHSEEQLQKIGFNISKVDIPTQIEQFYQSFLGRTADATGKAFWVDKLTTGALPLEGLATIVIESVEMQSHYAASIQWDFSL
jgi:hypothetical protein